MGREGPEDTTINPTLTDSKQNNAITESKQTN